MRTGAYLEEVRTGWTPENSCDREKFFESLLDMEEDACMLLNDFYVALKSAMLNTNMAGLLDDEAASIESANKSVEALSEAYVNSEGHNKTFTIHALGLYMNNRLQSEKPDYPDYLARTFLKRFPVQITETRST